MKSMIRVCSPRLALLAATAALILFAPLASAEAPAEPRTPEGQVVLFKLYAEGVQIYECKVLNPDARALRYQWVPTGPDAVLTDAKGDKVGKHYAGPTWEADDGSKVIADKKPVETTPKPPAVPWLLLKATSHEGDGKFSKVTYIRRVDTEGGAAPAVADFAYQGTELRVPYKATYIFYGAAKP
jgi:Protein of unknown function (DUF3455)